MNKVTEIDLTGEPFEERVMLVSNKNDIKSAEERVVFMEKDGHYLAWSSVKTLKERRIT